jgi:hypothetical protein
MSAPVVRITALSRDGTQAMTEQQTRKLSEMAIGEEGVCSLKALYGGQTLPV